MVRRRGRRPACGIDWRRYPCDNSLIRNSHVLETGSTATSDVKQ